MQRIASRWLLKRLSIPDICSKTKYAIGGDVRREVKVRGQSYRIAMVGRNAVNIHLPQATTVENCLRFEAIDDLRKGTRFVEWLHMLTLSTGKVMSSLRRPLQTMAKSKLAVGTGACKSLC
jgi:hypothetical protein